MSVTSQIKRGGKLMDYLQNEVINHARALAFVNEHNTHLAGVTPITVPGSDVKTVGTAMAYRLHFELSTAERIINSTVAGRGARATGLMPWFTSVVHAAFRDADKRAMASVVCALFEQPGRGREASPLLYILSGMHHHLPTTGLNARAVFEQGANTVDDVQALAEHMPTLFEYPQFNAITQYKTNPTFDGSADVNGADAACILNSALVDVRSSRLHAPMTMEFVYQQVAYILLDYSNEHNITHFAWWYTRQKTFFIHPVYVLVPDVEEHRYGLMAYLAGDFTPDWEPVNKHPFGYVSPQVGNDQG